MGRLSLQDRRGVQHRSLGNFQRGLNQNLKHLLHSHGSIGVQHYHRPQKCISCLRRQQVPQQVHLKQGHAAAHPRPRAQRRQIRPVLFPYSASSKSPSSIPAPCSTESSQCCLWCVSKKPGIYPRYPSKNLSDYHINANKNNYVIHKDCTEHSLEVRLHHQLAEASDAAPEDRSIELSGEDHGFAGVWADCGTAY